MKVQFVPFEKPKPRVFFSDLKDGGPFVMKSELDGNNGKPFPENVMIKIPNSNPRRSYEGWAVGLESGSVYIENSPGAVEVVRVKGHFLVEGLER